MRLHKRLIENKSLLPSNSTLLLAISGGQDSMALLKLITDLQRLYKWQIEIWHGDHQWHDKSEEIKEELSYLEAEIYFVLAFCANAYAICSKISHFGQIVTFALVSELYWHFFSSFA